MKKIDVDKMTVQEMYAAHQELWFWLADNPTKTKYDWPGWEKYNRSVFEHCFVCDFTNRHALKYYNSVCEFCPLDWIPCNTHDSLWSNYNESSGDTAELVADLIANVPLKKEYQQ